MCPSKEESWLQTSAERFELMCLTTALYCFCKRNRDVLSRIQSKEGFLQQGPRSNIIPVKKTLRVNVIFWMSVHAFTER